MSKLFENVVTPRLYVDSRVVVKQINYLRKTKSTDLNITYTQNWNLQRKTTFSTRRSYLLSVPNAEKII